MSEEHTVGKRLFDLENEIQALHHKMREHEEILKSLKAKWAALVDAADKLRKEVGDANSETT